MREGLSFRRLTSLEFRNSIPIRVEYRIAAVVVAFARVALIEVNICTRDRSAECDCRRRRRVEWCRRRASDLGTAVHAAAAAVAL